MEGERAPVVTVTRRAAVPDTAPLFHLFSFGLGAITNLLLGEPKGIEAHNVYEVSFARHRVRSRRVVSTLVSRSSFFPSSIFQGDASIVRKDYYAPDNPTHDVTTLHMPFFQELVDAGGDVRTPGLDVCESSSPPSPQFPRR